MGSRRHDEISKLKNLVEIVMEREKVYNGIIEASTRLRKSRIKKGDPNETCCDYDHVKSIAR
jgi:hypothetical protein